MKRYRKKRKGEYTCTCNAYNFPHRFSGGKCVGMFIIEEAYCQSNATCETCILNNKEGDYPYCEVQMGIEDVSQCPLWQEFKDYNEIDTYKRGVRK
jgi:hypothetical protein